MKRLIILLLYVAFAAACSNEHSPLPAEPGITELEISGDEEGGTGFDYHSECDWKASTADSRYEVSPTEGHAGVTRITLRTLAANNTGTILDLEPLVIRKQNGEEQRIAVRMSAARTGRVMLHLFIGSSLRRYFAENMEQSMSAMNEQMPVDGRVAAFCLEGNVWQLCELRYNAHTGRGEKNVIKEYHDLNRNEPALFTTVLNDLHRYFPAREYGIAMGGHGKGWVPRTPAARRVFDEPRQTHLTRHFGEPGSHFDITEIAQGILASEIRPDYIIIDACLMSNIEALYALRHAARYIVSSPTEILNPGFPYQYILPEIFAEADLEERMKNVCRAYHRFYAEEYSLHSGCIALCDCSQLEALAAATRTVLQSAPAECIPAELQNYDGYTRTLFYDFRQYVEQVATSTEALEKFNLQFERCFPREGRLHTEQFYSDFGEIHWYTLKYYSGVSSSIPSELYREDLGNTEWWQAAR